MSAEMSKISKNQALGEVAEGAAHVAHQYTLYAVKRYQVAQENFRAYAESANPDALAAGETAHREVAELFGKVEQLVRIALMASQAGGDK